MSWSEKIKGAISNVKDSGASAAIERWLAREIADYGELLDFRLNSSARSVQVRLLLKGEKEPLTVEIDEYEALSSGGEDFVVIRRARASRPWVDAVLRNFLLNKKQKIPAQYSSMAKLVLNG